MSQDRDPALGGGANSRPLNDTAAETGPGVPDDSVGPEQRSISDQMDLARDADAQAIARKLQDEVDARHGLTDDDVAAAEDPTGHA
jgi:hypothetical protein